MRRMRAWALVLAMLVIVLVGELTTARPQPPKPIGLFELDDLTARPWWVSFALIPDWHDEAHFRAAAAESRRTGIRWVMGFYSRPLAEPLEAHAADVRARADRAGLTPFVIGTVYYEEWYELFKAGALDVLGLDPTKPADVAQGIEIIRRWTGRQHAVIKAAFPHAHVVWLTNFANNDPRFGLNFWQPVPPGVDLVALDTYIPRGGTFETHVEPYFAHAAATLTQPLVLIPQWFRIPGTDWAHEPTDSDIAGWARWYQHPRVVAMWGFLWDSRPISGIDGLEDLPRLRAAVEQSLGVQ